MPVKTPSDPKKSEVIAIPRLPWRYIGSAMKNFWYMLQVYTPPFDMM